MVRGSGQIRIGDRGFDVAEAALQRLELPNGTLRLTLQVRGADRTLPVGFRLEDAVVPGPRLDDVRGHVTELVRGEVPHPSDRGRTWLRAGLYLGDHNELTANRITWVGPTETGFQVEWTGHAPDLERYDVKTRQPFELRVDAHVVPLPFELVRCGMTCGAVREVALVRPVTDEVVAALSAALSERGWFAAMPFCALDLIVRVTAPRRRWDPPPPRLRDYAAGVVVDLDARLVRRGDREALREAFDRQVDTALRALERQRQAAPRLLG